ncbi:Major Facilitator Superfamily (MFS), partial [Phytophthora palmivora]
PLQYGWSTTQLNLTAFNDEDACNVSFIKPGTCLMFPGHTKTQWTIAVSAWIFGGMLGSLVIGRVSNKFGRKRIMMVNCLFMFIGAIVQASASTIGMFIGGRVISGIASGGATAVIPGFISEISPPYLRNSLGVGFQMAITIGNLLVAITFFYADTSSGWRYIAGFPVVLAMLFLVSAPFVIVESPAWLLVVGKQKHAEHELARLFGEENVYVAKMWIKHDHLRPRTSSSCEHAVDTPERFKFARLFSPMLIRQLLTAIGIAGAQQLTGINAVFFYSSTLFEQAGISDDRIGIVAVNFVNVLPTLFCGMLAARVGNRKLMLYGLTGMFLSALGITVSLVASLPALAIVFTASYVTTFGSSLGSLAWVVMADLFPDEARAMGNSVCVGCSWLSNLTVGLSYPYIAAALVNFSFTPFMCTIALSFVFVYLAVPDTSGKTMQEIQDEFDARRLSKNKSGHTSGYVWVAPTPMVMMPAPAAEEETAVVKPTWRLYANILVAVLQALQFGWSTSQMNNSIFNNEEDCNARPIAPGTCLMFPGHTKTQWTIAVSSWIVGGMIGSLLTGRVSNKFGRKPTMMANCLFMIAGGAIQATSNTITIFTVGRVFAGIAAGGSTAVIPGFIGEICPPHLRSKLGVCFQISITLGHLFVAITFFFASTSTGWRYIAGFPIVLASLFLLLAPIVLVESPAWLLMVNKPKQAEEELARLFGEDNVYAAKKWINQDDPESKREGSVRLQDLGMSMIAPAPDGPNGGTLSKLFSSLLLPQLLTAIGVAGAQQLTGVNAVFFYSSGIFKQAGLSDSRIGVLLVNFVNVLPTLVCGMLAAKVGNRKLILYGFIGMLLSAVGITVSLVASLSPLAIVFVALYVTTFGASLGPLAWGVMADLFPDDVRAVGCSICVGCSWLCSLTIGLVYPYLAAALVNYSFVPFMYTITLSFLFFFQIVPDTYGKTIQEIQDEFNAKWQKSKKKPQWRMSGNSQIPVLG